MDERIHLWAYLTPTHDYEGNAIDPAYSSSDSWTALCGELILRNMLRVVTREYRYKITCEACILLAFVEDSE